jgi:hypothetical protein
MKTMLLKSYRVISHIINLIIYGLMLKLLSFLIGIPFYEFMDIILLTFIFVFFITEFSLKYSGLKDYFEEKIKELEK